MLSSSPATCPHENHEWVDNLTRPHVREGSEHTHNFTPSFAERKRAELNVGFLDSPFSARIYRELCQADKCKDEFLATVVHELRASLAPIRNALAIMGLAGNDCPAVERSRSIIERQVMQMTRLVDDLMDVSGIAHNKLSLRKEQVQLADIIGSAVETSHPLIERSGHELTVSLPPEPVYLHADQARLVQVFSNLLNNSAKYTDCGGRIWLTAALCGGELIVRVRDTGVGILPEAMPRLFEMFSQVDCTAARAQGGLGIGLALVRRLVELHGGTVEAHSEGIGRGSEFVVTLPFINDDSWENRGTVDFVAYALQ
jgi:signal transduction histidine kinase